MAALIFLTEADRAFLRPQIDWVSELDLLKTTRNCSETELAALIGIKKGFLADIRSGRRPMPPGVKLAIANELNRPLTRDLLISLFVPAIQEQIYKIDKKRALPDIF